MDCLGFLQGGLHRLPGIDRAFLALYGLYKQYIEAGPINRLRDFVPSGALVIDVGANVGFFTVRFARWVGTSGEVIAIEPEGRNYDSLISVLKREDLLDRVRALKAVAAAVSGAALLEINPLYPADHKLSRDGIASTQQLSIIWFQRREFYDRAWSRSIFRARKCWFCRAPSIF